MATVEEKDAGHEMMEERGVATVTTMMECATSS
jgi:hypothetical protein